jgi:ferredoxin
MHHGVDMSQESERERSRLGRVSEIVHGDNTMRVVVDVQRCAGFASCMILVPEVFEISREDNVAHVVQDHPAAELRSKLEEAVRACPVGAISLHEDE